MNSQDILKKIVPCDTQKPYIFISYSSRDKDLVWQDVLTYQEQGYNVWLDEKNLDKTKASWKEDALLAIEDMYCMLVVFYVSKSSLVSESCYNELAKTVDELTIALHYGPVKFIAIDVDDVGNIGDFTRELHQSVFSDDARSKSEKSKMLLTLHQFMKNFFDTNNEKVRIHPKNEENRKMNYYEEILASFPDMTHNMEVKAEITEKKETSDGSVKKTTLASKLTSGFVQEDLKTESDKKKLKLDEPVVIEEKAETGTCNLFTVEELSRAVEAANRDAQNFQKFYPAAEVKEKRLQNAVKSYAKGITIDQILWIKDTTFFDTGKEGFLITEDCLYFNSYKLVVKLNELAVCEKRKEKDYLYITYKDGRTERIFVNIFAQQIKTFFDALLSMR